MIAAILLILIAAAYRLLFVFMDPNHAGWLANFAPFAALALCGAIYLPKRFALIIPFAALGISDLILNAHYGTALINSEMLMRYVALGLVAGLGFAIRRNPRFLRVLGGSVVGSFLFYLLTNTTSWLTDPGYVKTFGGWFQALTVGLPGYEPTWMFFRNSAVSDLLFTAIFVGCFALSKKKSSLTANAIQPSKTANAAAHHAA